MQPETGAPVVFVKTTLRILTVARSPDNDIQCMSLLQEPGTDMSELVFLNDTRRAEYTFTVHGHGYKVTL